MQILFICDEYPPGPSGGVGTAVQLLARELVRQGHCAIVAGLYSYSFGGKSYENDQGVEVYRFRYGINLHLPHSSIGHKIFNRIPGIIKKRLNGLSAFKKFTDFVQQTVRERNIDIIELADWNTFAMRIGFKVEWPAFEVPLLIKQHGSYSYFQHELNEPAKKHLVQIDEALVKRADAIAAVSGYTAQVNKKLFAIDKPIKVLYNGIHLPEATSKISGKFNVIFTGTLMQKKGIFQLIKAWNAVVKTVPEARLNIFGKGPQAPLLALLDKDAINTVAFEGHVARPYLMEQLAKATLAVFPSFSETFGLAVVEAMSVGCPVIFTKLSCGPEIVENGLEGELVNPANIDEISHSIIKLLKDDELREKFRVAALSKVREKFNIAVIAREHVSFYEKVTLNFNPR